MSMDNYLNRRAVLWNVQQPGDAYDIRKSMIAKLPQHPARFMGDNLELVCLFQAAEIQRLAQFLDEMTLEMRAIERVDLDRHSYEVQIKQLAQKLQVANEYKNENIKLRQFIKGQSQQLNHLQKYRNSSQNLIQIQTKYESVLNQLRITRQNYSSLQKTNNQTLREITQWKFKYDRLEKFLNEEKQARQKQIKMAIQKNTFEIKSIYEARQYQLKGEINVMKENLVIKNRQIELQKSKNTSISKMLTEKDQLIGKYMRGQIQVQGTKAQQFLRISRRLQESTYYLEQKQKSILNMRDQIAYLTKRNRQNEEDLKKKEEQIARKDEQIRKKTAQIIAKQQTFNNDPNLLFNIAQSEKKIIMLSSQIERLKQTLNLKEKQTLDKQKQFSFYKQKSNSYEKTVEFLQKQLKQKQNMIKKMQYDSHIFEDKDNKIAALGAQIQRLNIILRQKLNQMARLQNHINQVNYSYNQQFNLLKAREQAIKILQEKCKDYDFKMVSLEESNKLNFDEINRLNLKLTDLQNQNIQLRRQIDSKMIISSEITQLKNQISALHDQLNRKTTENKKLREDNELMFKEIHQSEERIHHLQAHTNQLKSDMDHKMFQKDQHIKNLQFTFSKNQQSYLQKIAMLQQSMPKMSAEIERLHQLIAKRNGQLKKCQEDIEIQRQKNRLLERKNSTQTQMRVLQYEKTLAFYQSKSKNLEKINSDLSNEKNFIIEKCQTLQNRLRDTQVQLDRIMAVLKVKEASFEEYEKNRQVLQSTIKQLRDENLRLQSESMKSRQQVQVNFEMMRKLQYEIDLCRKDLSKAQNDCSGLYQENVKLKSMLQQSGYRNPLMNEKMESLEHQLRKCEKEREYLIEQVNDKKLRIQNYQQELRELQSKISQYQESFKLIEQANAVKLQEMKQRLMQEYEMKIKNETVKYNRLQQMYKQVEGNYKRTMENRESVNRIESLESQNRVLVEQLTSYQERVFSYEERFALLSQQIERLTMENRELRDENKELRDENKELRDENKELRDENRDLKNENKELSIENKELRDELKERKNNQSQVKAIGQLHSQLQKTQIQVKNLKQILIQYQSINQHALAERDQLFTISHQQQEKINHYIQQINKLSQQINRLNQQINRLSQQLEVLRLNNNQRQRLNNDQQQMVRAKEQYNSLMNQFITLKQQYTQVLIQLDLANKRVTQFNQATIREKLIQNQQRQAQRQQREAQRQQREAQRQQRQIQTQQMQLRLHNITQHYETGLRQQRQRVSELQINLQKQSKALTIMEKQHTQMKTQIIQLQNDNIRLQNQNKQLQHNSQQLQREIKQLQQKRSSQEEILVQVEQLKTAYINIKMENQQLNRLLQEMQEQLFQAKDQNQRLSQQRIDHQELLNQNTQLKLNLQQERQTLTLVQQKLNHLSSQIQHTQAQAQINLSQTQQQLTQTQQQLTQAVIKVNSLQHALLSTQQENTLLKQQIQSLTVELSQIPIHQQKSSEMQFKYNALYQAYEDLYKIYNLLKQEHQITTNNLKDTQLKIQKLNQQFNKLNTIISQLKNQVLSLNQENHSLNQQNHSLKQDYHNYQSQYHQLSLNNQDLQKQLQRIYQLNLDLNNQVSQIRLRLSDQHTLQEKIKQNMILFVMMAAQIQSLRKRVLQTQQECQEVRRSSISPLKTKK